MNTRFTFAEIAAVQPIRRSHHVNHVISETQDEVVLAQIAAANKVHDAKYGWSYSAPHIYTNAGRYSESVMLPSGLTCDDDVWDAITGAEEFEG